MTDVMNPKTENEFDDEEGKLNREKKCVLWQHCKFLYT